MGMYTSVRGWIEIDFKQREVAEKIIERMGVPAGVDGRDYPRLSGEAEYFNLFAWPKC